ncbi:FAD-binding oxidoreductase [Salinibacterium sp. ZJ450]|uniref:FAD-binding oxidoreductase n=1 Tax=Salinibacterium sp. ZJ450 TaxID=2708338 RepID=UPI0014245398|nr:FAD-binding oxidoreductase [Salinibacterium sp. ZJ450]
MPEFAELRARISSPVFTPSDPGFPDETTGFNLAVTHQPDAVVVAENESDIAQTVRFARENGMPVRVQATGHGATEPYTDGVLVITRKLDRVSIDAQERTATFGAGVRWAAVLAAAAEHHLAPITGSSPQVGAVGFLLGGGLGPLARSHGFGSDYLRELRLVTGLGEIVVANYTEHPDLFWALRGGKGGLGIVTQATIELIEADTLYAGSLVFDEPHIEQALRAWVDWSASAPDEVTSSVALMRMPDLDLVPPPLRGRHVLSVRVVSSGPVDAGPELADPLRQAAPVYLDLLGELPTSRLGLVHNDPTDPVPVWDHGMLLTPIDQDFASALLGEVGPGTEIPVVITEVRHIGAGTKIDVDEGSAVGGRNSDYSLAFIGMEPELFETVLPAFADRVSAAVAPWVSPELTINFIGRTTSPDRVAKAWPSDILNRLTEVRHRYDPEGVFPYGY